MGVRVRTQCPGQLQVLNGSHGWLQPPLLDAEIVAGIALRHSLDDEDADCFAREVNTRCSPWL